MQVADQTVVSIHYTLTDEGGRVLDSSEGRDPLPYLHGYGTIIPGLERALAGRSIGDRLQVTLGPKEGYGPRDESLVYRMPRSDFEDIGDFREGMRLEVQISDESRVVTVKEIQEETVKVDGNHPLAGETLNFEVEITDIRSATDEELAHGHVHVHGQHH